MIRKSLALSLAFVMLAGQVYGQVPDISSYVDQFKSIIGSSANSASGSVTEQSNLKLVSLRSPFTLQQFDAYVDIESHEYAHGQYKVVCPYTGKPFYAGEGTKEEPQMQSVKVRSPFTGQVFTAQLDLNRLLLGAHNETVLVCPYTGESFNFDSQPISDDKAQEMKLEGFERVLDKRVGKYFKVYSQNGQFPSIVQSPYTGVTIYLDDDRKEIQNQYSKLEEIYNERLLKVHKSKPLQLFGYNMFEFEEAFDRVQSEAGSQTESKLQDLQSKLALQGVEGMDAEGIPAKHKNALMKTVYESVTFEPISSMPVEPDYVLGPGDTLIITIWGKAQQVIEEVIDRSGKVLLPQAGAIYLWGQTFAEAQNIIGNALDKYYSNIKYDVTLGKLRTIRVFVFGKAKKPGSYILSSRATAFHSLYMAGGPAKQGSFRNITLKRKDAEPVKIDLYDVLLKGDKSQDVRLQSEDVVFVNPLGKTVAIAGAVGQPAIYEIGSVLSYSELVKMAGGVLPTADQNNVRVLRVDPQNSGQKFISVPRQSQEAFKLQDGDIVWVPPVSNFQKNYVTIEGNVVAPGEFPYKQGLKLSDLVRSAGGFLPATYYNRVEVIRQAERQASQMISVSLSMDAAGAWLNDLELQDGDRVVIYSLHDLNAGLKVAVRGVVKSPGEYDFYENMRVSDLVFKAGLLTSEPEHTIAELYTVDALGKGQIVPINIVDLFRNPENYANNPTLQARDLLVLRALGISAKRKYVRLDGAFKTPGEYPILPGDRISDVIKRAGGYSSNAYLKGAVFLRDSVKKTQMLMAEQLIQSQKQNLLKEESTLIKGEQHGDESAAERNRTLRHRGELLDMLAQSKLLGRMTVSIEDDEEFVGSENDVILEDGDSISVPYTPLTVNLIGSVYNPSAVLYERNRGLNYYLNKVGGVTRGADRKRTYVIKSNGEIVSYFNKIRSVERGDTIVVPEKFQYKTPTGVLIKDTVQILYQMALGAAVVANLD